MSNLWAGSGSRLLVLGLKRKDRRCQFGFGGGSRLLVFLETRLFVLGLEAYNRRPWEKAQRPWVQVFGSLKVGLEEGSGSPWEPLRGPWYLF